LGLGFGERGLGVCERDAHFADFTVLFPDEILPQGEGGAKGERVGQTRVRNGGRDALARGEVVVQGRGSGFAPTAGGGGGGGLELVERVVVPLELRVALLGDPHTEGEGGGRVTRSVATPRGVSGCTQSPA
jgi:hypothetical protein